MGVFTVSRVLNTTPAFFRIKTGQGEFVAISLLISCLLIAYFKNLSQNFDWVALVHVVTWQTYFTSKLS